MYAIRRHLVTATRSLLARPGFTAVAVLTLALGIGANAAIFSVVNVVMLKPLPYEDAARLVMLWSTNSETGEREGFISYPDLRDWRERSTSFTDISAFWTFANGDVNLTGGSQPERVPVARVLAGYFELLGAAPLHGRTFLAEENVVGNHRRAILSYALWQRQFGGDPDLVGRSVNVNGFPYTVVGIMGADFRPLGTVALGDPVQLWRPLAPNDNQTGGRGSRTLRAVARLAPGISLRQAQNEMDQIARDLRRAYSDTNDDIGVRLVPLRQQVVQDVRAALVLLLAAVVLVLLIACANVANLMLVRGAELHRALAIHMALGASRGRIVARLMTESLLIGVTGAALGLVFAYGVVRGLVAVGPRDIPLLGDVRLDWAVWGFAGLLAVVTAILFGLAPAVRVSRIEPATSLRDGGRRTGRHTDRRVADGLVVVEVAMAMVLLVAGGLLIRSFQELLRIEPGLDPQGVLTFQLELPMATTYPTQPERETFFTTLIERVTALPDVESATMASTPPVEEQVSRAQFTISGRSDPAANVPVRGNFRMVAPDYFATLRIPILTGRALGPRDIRGSPPVAVISRTAMTAYWGDESPLGHRIQLPFGPEAEIVGVVGDVRTGGLDADLVPTVYVAANQWGYNFMTVIARAAGDPAALVPRIRNLIGSMDPNLPVYNVRPMEELVTTSVAQQRFQMSLISGFSLLALALAVLGTYGVVSYSVSQRVNEIGIRTALGARPADTLRLVLWQGMRLATVGTMLGIAGAVASGRLVAGFLFNVGPVDVATYALVSLVLLAAAATATYIPARRATRVDPVIALRTE